MDTNLPFLSPLPSLSHSYALSTGFHVTCRHSKSSSRSLKYTSLTNESITDSGHLTSLLVLSIRVVSQHPLSFPPFSPHLSPSLAQTRCIFSLSFPPQPPVDIILFTFHKAAASPRFQLHLQPRVSSPVYLLCLTCSEQTLLENTTFSLPFRTLYPLPFRSVFMSTFYPYHTSNFPRKSPPLSLSPTVKNANGQRSGVGIISYPPTITEIFRVFRPRGYEFVPGGGEL